MKGICAILDASDSPVSATKRTVVLLTELPSEFDAVVFVASFSSTLVPFQRIVNTLLDYESCQTRAIQEIAFAANLVEDSSPLVLDGSVRGGRSMSRGRGRGFRPRLQYQIYARFGHVARRCFYQYRRDDPPVSSPAGSARDILVLPIGLFHCTHGLGFQIFKFGKVGLVSMVLVTVKLGRRVLVGVLVSRMLTILHGVGQMLVLMLVGS